LLGMWDIGTLSVREYITPQQPASAGAGSAS
jgi:hypothetical protein